MERARQDSAARNYDRAVIELKIASQNMPKDPEPVYQLGMTYLSAGSGRLALAAFQKVMTLDPKHQGARYQLALFRLGSSKKEILEEARQPISEWIAGHQNDGEAIAYLGLAEAKLGNTAEAIRLFEEGAMKDTGSLRVAGMAIAVYTARGDVVSAKEVASHLADRLPNSAEAATLRAQVALAVQDTDEADAEISRALALKRDFQPALVLRLRREMVKGESGDAEGTTRQLSQLPEKRLWGAYARILFSENRLDRGIAEYERALKEHDNDIRLRDEYASMLLVAERRKQAESVVAETLAKKPKDVDALMVRTILEIDRGDPDAAAADVKTLRDLKVASAQLSYQESRIFAMRGDVLHEGDLLADALKRDRRLLGARLELSRLLVGAGKAKEALGLLDQAPGPLKRTAEYIYYRNMALLAAGDWDQARASVDNALALARTPGFLYQDGLVRIQSGDLAGARKSLEAAFQQTPGDLATLKTLGDVMRRQGAFAQYVSMVKDAAAKNGNVAVLQYATGRLLEEQGDAGGARRAFEAAITAGDVVDADNDIAMLDLRAGATDKARERLLNLIKDHDNARARISLAEIETQRGSGDLPVQHYLKAIQLEPANGTAMENLAVYLATSQKKYDDAVFWAQKALALQPNDPTAQDTAGWTYYLSGKYNLALPLLQKSARLFDRPLVHYHLAAGLFRAGDPRSAKSEYEAGLKEDPNSPARALVARLFETGKVE